MDAVHRDLLCPSCGQAERDREPQRVITLRLPKSLHGRLKEEAHAAGVSLNTLCLGRVSAETCVAVERVQ